MIPQLDNVKSAGEHLNASMILPYPADTPFGNLQLAHLELIGRIDYVNKKLAALYQDYALLMPRQRGLVPPAVLEFRLRTEEIVYWIRKTIDTLIAMTCMVGEHGESGRYP